MQRLVERLRDTENELRREVDEQQQRWKYQIHRGRIWFDKELRDAHRRAKQSIPSYIRHGSVPNLLTAPIIYSLLLPFVVLDAWTTVYQWTCFPIYGIPLVSRRAYFALDRHNLAYLNGIEKIHCTYCSYVNGLIAYVREVAARTEQFWCPIKHARAVPTPHQRYHAFFDYGDAHGYRKGLSALRHSLKSPNDRMRIDRTPRERNRARPSGDCPHSR
jgi:hypothetical protein